MKRLLMSSRIEYLDQAWKYFVNETYVQVFDAQQVECHCVLNIKDAKALANAYDGLLLCGGYDIEPSLYQESRHPKTITYDRGVDRDDFLLMEQFIQARKPILGICRGLQLINVYFNGTLTQHFEAETHEESKHCHRISTIQNTKAAQLYGDSTTVNSFHHQCVNQIGDHLIIGAKANDGRIEALEHDSLPIIGVQWHPERLSDDPIIPYFASLLGA